VLTGWPALMAGGWLADRSGYLYSWMGWRAGSC